MARSTDVTARRTPRRRAHVLAVAALAPALAAGTVVASAGGAAAAPAGPGRGDVVAVAATVAAWDAAAPPRAVSYSPAVPPGARIAVVELPRTTGTTFVLAVSGLQPGRTYGAHVHAAACGATGAAAGPHFQHVPDPVQPSTDPAYANPENEVWLDVAVGARGAGYATATVPWRFADDRRGQSLVIHEMATATDPGTAGTAGGRLACLTVPF
ncbi:superoxide dismutase [Kineococcus sp. R8]|uniref:superoxide dismutase family protein n=1 Tax=Kineococcus siccus TaxID=2696567 RepID=UPI001412F775|nr:superoxide dismutase family protein [Kineococcus siccus]NAZ81221.1 superoxide dismutase [Kineococcus siccus]